MALELDGRSVDALRRAESDEVVIGVSRHLLTAHKLRSSLSRHHSSSQQGVLWSSISSQLLPDKETA
jgi:hypothetical protein